MSRLAPPRTPAQQKAHERVEAMKAGTAAALRTWAAKWGVHLFGDDAFLLWAIHDARVDDKAMSEQVRAESREWLRTHPKPAD